MLADAVDRSHPGVVPEDEMQRIVTRVIEAIGRMDMAPVRNLLADDAVLEFPFAPPGLATHTHGADAIVSSMAVMPRMFSAFDMTAEQIYTSPDSHSVIVEASSRATRLDGSPYENRYVSVFTFRGDRIALWREFFDPTKIPEPVP